MANAERNRRRLPKILKITAKMAQRFKMLKALWTQITDHVDVSRHNQHETLLWGNLKLCIGNCRDAPMCGVPVQATRRALRSKAQWQFDVDTINHFEKRLKEEEEKR